MLVADGYLFKLKARKWDFTTAFSPRCSRVGPATRFYDAGDRGREAEAPSGGFWNSNGQVKIDEFAIRKGGKQMAAEKAHVPKRA